MCKGKENGKETKLMEESRKENDECEERERKGKE